MRLGSLDVIILTNPFILLELPFNFVIDKMKLQLNNIEKKRILR